MRGWGAWRRGAGPQACPVGSAPPRRSTTCAGPCVSRALDDREITLQKQSRAFFQISGAGHEALLLGLARSLRPGYDWFFPYYRDRALMLGARGHARSRSSCRRSDRPTTRRRAAGRCRATGAHAGDQRRHPVVGHRQPVPARGRLRRGRPLHPGPPACPGCARLRRRAHLRLPRRGRHRRRASSGRSLNTACRLHLPVLFVVADNGYAISVPSEDQSPAPISELVRGFRGLAITKLDGRDYFEAAPAGGPGRRPRPGRRGSRPHPRQGHPAVLALGGRHPVQVPADRRSSTTRSPHDPIRQLEKVWSRPAC